MLLLLLQIHESSPLDLASEESERLPCLLALLDFGADVNARDRHGKYSFFCILLCYFYVFFFPLM